MRKIYLCLTAFAFAVILSGCHNHKEGEACDHEHSEESKDHNHDHEGGDKHAVKAEPSKEAHEEATIEYCDSEAKAAGLKLYKITPRTFNEVIKTSGQIISAQGDEATIAATANGFVTFSNPSVSDGTAIGAGNTIAYISAKNIIDGDPTAKVKISFETAKKEYERAEKLVKDKIISAKEFEQIRMQYENAKIAYKAQSSHVTSRGITVTSPIRGYIKNRLVNQGEYVTVGQPIVTVSQNKRLQLRADLPEHYFSRINLITHANFKTPYDNRLYKLSSLNGTLVSYSRSSEKTSGFIPITFSFDNRGEVVAGSYVEVYLISSPQQGVIAIPETALTEEQGLYFVYLKTAPGHYRKQEVAIGANDGECVRILSGLKAGEEVVSHGAYQVKLASSSKAIPHGHSH